MKHVIALIYLLILVISCSEETTNSTLSVIDSDTIIVSESLIDKEDTIVETPDDSFVEGVIIDPIGLDSVYLDTVTDTVVLALYDDIITGNGPETWGQMRKLTGGVVTIGHVSATPDKSSFVAQISPFYMDTTEVTFADYKSLVPHEMNIASGYEQYYNTADNAPVTCISRPMMLLYCNERSKRDGFDTVYTYDSVQTFADKFAGHAVINNDPHAIAKLYGFKPHYDRVGYRLPSSAEWEYAARGGVDAQTYWGVDYFGTNAKARDLTREDTLEIQKYAAWYERGDMTLPLDVVATRIPNAYGLYDMFGNADEFVEDVYAEIYQTSVSETSASYSGKMFYIYDSLAAVGAPIIDPMGPVIDDYDGPDGFGYYYTLRGGDNDLYTSHFLHVSKRRGDDGAGLSSVGFRAVLPIRK